MSRPKLAATPLHPPHSMEAEQSVLGGLLLKNRLWFEVADKLVPEDFYTMDHRLIFMAIGDMLNAGKPCDFVTLSEKCRIDGTLQDVGGLSYLGTLAADTPSTANILAYAEIVAERASLRRLIEVAQDLGEAGYKPEGRTIDVIVNAAEQSLTDLRLRGARGQQTGQMVDQLMESVSTMIEARANKSLPPALPTHLPELNNQLNGGMADGDLIIVGGRPGMGKSALCFNFAEHVAINLRLPVAIFSMEMPAQQVVERFIADRASIPLWRILKGELRNDDWDAFAKVDRDIRTAPLLIDDTGGLNPHELRARAKRFKAKHGCRLVVVDYLQLMEAGSGRGQRNREGDISEITRKLKALAKELACPIIALSQLSRSLESRDNKRPMLSDLRESGSIEQDADKVLFVYRPEYHERNESKAESGVDKGLAEIIVAKQRNGPTGAVDARFTGEFCRFTPWDGPPKREREAAKKRDSEAASTAGIGRRGRKAAANTTGSFLPPEAPDPDPTDYGS